MTTRTIKQFGIAYGTETANITAKINNAVVYQGPVTTLNESFPELPNVDYIITNELFSWTVDVAFSGPQTIEIDVDGTATLLVAELQANYMATEFQGNILSSNANFIGFAYSQFGNTYINGSLQPNNPHVDPYYGQFWWPIPPGGNFVEEITIPQGLE